MIYKGSWIWIKPKHYISRRYKRDGKGHPLTYKCCYLGGSSPLCL